MNFLHRLKITALLILPILFLTGCPPVKKPVAPPFIPVPKPLFEKTFGEITYEKPAALLIRYKDIVVLIDPGALAPEALPHIDYLLLTDLQPHHFGEKARQGLRKNLKILTTHEGTSTLQSAGFSQAKGLSKGQRILLKKNEDFLFVGVLQSRNPASGQTVNGYLLEFDNGKNLFVSGEIVDESVMREFLYGLRDDGKEIDLAFIYGGGLRGADKKVLQSANEEVSAMFIGLLQPRVAIVLQSTGLERAAWNPSLLQSQLKDQIFSGELYIPKSGEIIPF